MEKKSSVGVTLFGWSFIILNLFYLIVIFGIGIPKGHTFLSDSSLYIITLCSLVSCILGAIVGVNVLLLKEWSRKLIMILAILPILLMIITFYLPGESVERFNRPNKRLALHKIYDHFGEDIKVTLRKVNIQSKEDYIVFSMGVSRAADVTIGIAQIIYGILILLFFTRPKVKEQFR